MPRQARLDSPGTLHHVIIRGIEKRRIVDDKVEQARLVQRMGDLSKETGTSVYTWSVMTNHAHILLKGGHSILFMSSTFFKKRIWKKSTSYGFILQKDAPLL